MLLARDGGEPPLASIRSRMQRAAGDDRHVVAVLMDEIFRELSQQLARRRLIGPVGAVEEADLHARP